jgi:hypothetical protein
MSCLNCSKECILCNDFKSTNCSQCNAGYYLYLNSCLTICPDGYYGKNSTWECDICDPIVIILIFYIFSVKHVVALQVKIVRFAIIICLCIMANAIYLVNCLLME